MKTIEKLPKEAMPPKEWWNQDAQEAFLAKYSNETIQHRGIEWEIKVNEDGVFAINKTMPNPAFMPWINENDATKTFSGLLEQIDLTLLPEAEDFLVTERIEDAPQKGDNEMKTIQELKRTVQKSIDELEFLIDFMKCKVEEVKLNTSEGGNEAEEVKRAHETMCNMITKVVDMEMDIFAG